MYRSFMIKIIVLLSVISGIFGDEYHHYKPKKLNAQKTAKYTINPEEKTTEFWFDNAQAKLEELLNQKLNTNKAKNVILFLGDGMSFATVAATRMLLGGEEKELSFEKFPFYGLSKTYCVDAQVADSACTSTAFLTGVKTNYEVIGLNAAAGVHNCDSQAIPDYHTESIASWAQKACKATGIVTTTRITHASPSGAYAHIGHRDWENDHEVKLSDCDPEVVDDIAEQLVYNIEGQNFKVILGGGRSNFRNHSMIDEEGNNGYRTDGKDLIEEWKSERSKTGKPAYVWNKKGLQEIDIENTDYILGLFHGDHMNYNLEVQNENLQDEKPSLQDMTTTAIKMLQKEKNGYFLFVEGGMIDRAHHLSYAKMALDETVEFSKAIEAARKMTSEEDTLIVVTSDHSHVFTYNGYPERGSDIFDAVEVSDIDDMPYFTLSYGNGPGYHNIFDVDGTRKHPDLYDKDNYKMQFPATVPLERETHGGEDVGVHSSGPMSHLFSGHYEQNSIPVLMAYALEIGPYGEPNECLNDEDETTPTNPTPTPPLPTTTTTTTTTDSASKNLIPPFVLIVCLTFFGLF